MFALDQCQPSILTNTLLKHVHNLCKLYSNSVHPAWTFGYLWDPLGMWYASQLQSQHPAGCQLLNSVRLQTCCWRGMGKYYASETWKQLSIGSQNLILLLAFCSGYSLVHVEVRDSVQKNKNCTRLCPYLAEQHYK